MTLPYFNALYTSLARVQGFSLIVTTQFYYIKENGMTEDILFVVLLWSKNFVSGHQTQNVHAYNHNFSVSCFSSLGTHQTHYLDGYQAIGVNSSFIFIFGFWPLRFW